MSKETPKKPKVKSLRAEWNEFQHAYLTANASAEIRGMVQDSFYSGMATIFFKMINEIAELTDEEAEKKMAEMQQELVEYNEAIQDRFLQKLRGRIDDLEGKKH